MQNDRYQGFPWPQEKVNFVDFLNLYKQWQEHTGHEDDLPSDSIIRAAALYRLWNDTAMGKSLSRRILNEDFDSEFQDERTPFGYLIGDDLDVSIDNNSFFNNNADSIKAMRLALRSLLVEYRYHAQVDIEAAFRKCQSPIESILLSAMLMVFSRSMYTIKMETDTNWPYGMIHRAGNSPSSVMIKPQAAILRYTVDFLLIKRVIEVNFLPEAYRNGDPETRVIMDRQLADYSRVTKHIVVECDGHDFHEKSKEQVAKDKKRDRDIQKEGYKIFRFSGSEINKDSVSCAYEILDGLNSDSSTIEPIRPPKER